MRLRARVLLLVIILVGGLLLWTWSEVPCWYPKYIDSHRHVVRGLQVTKFWVQGFQYEKLLEFVFYFSVVMLLGNVAKVLAFYFSSKDCTCGDCVSFVSDDPIRSANADELDLGAYIQSLGALILHAPNNARAQFIGLYGHWGEGKTSARYLLEEYLRTVLSIECAPIFVDVNTLSFTSDHDLPYDFFRTVAEGVARGDAELRSAFLALADNMRARSFSRLFATDNLWITILKVICGLSKDLPQIKVRLKDALLRLRRRVVVVVDDLDRMSPQDVCAILRLLKGNGDLPSITYLILSDETYLAASIGDLMPESMPNGRLASGREYLEKIVTFECPLPEMTNNVKLQKYFRRLLLEVLKRYCIIGYNLDDDELECVFPYFSNIRALKRLLNAYEKDLALHQAKDGEGRVLSVHAGDLLALTALRLKDPDFYHLVYDAYKDLLKGEKWHKHFEGPNWGRIAQAFSCIGEKDSKSLAAVFSETRLKIKKTRVETGVGKCWYSLSCAQRVSAYANYRISSCHCFFNYFMAGTPEQMVRRQVLLDFIKSATSGGRDWEQIIESVDKGQKLQQLFLLLSDPPKLNASDQIERFLAVVACLAERDWKSDNAERLHAQILDLFDACCSRYSNQLSRGVFENVLRRIIGRRIRLSITAHLIDHKVTGWFTAQSRKCCIDDFLDRLKTSMGIQVYFEHRYRFEIAQCWARLLRDEEGEYLVRSMEPLKKMLRVKNGERYVIEVFLLPLEHQGKTVFTVDVGLMFKIFSQYEIDSICDCANTWEDVSERDEQIKKCLIFAVSRYKLGKDFDAKSQIDYCESI